MLRIFRSFRTLVHDSTIARFTTAMLTSLLITTTTLLPLLATLSQATPINRAAPVPQADAPPSDYSYPDPQPCLGNCSGIHDPNIVYDSDNGVYWRFTTSNNISIANSDSLEGPWTYQGPLLDNGTSIHVADDQDIWVRHETHYHLPPHQCPVLRIR